MDEDPAAPHGSHARRGPLQRGRSSTSPGWTGREFEVTVGPVAHGGHCVARHEGRGVFLRHAPPGGGGAVRGFGEHTLVIQSTPNTLLPLPPLKNKKSTRLNSSQSNITYVFFF